jgi:type IV pilus assembly protein PilV
MKRDHLSQYGFSMIEVLITLVILAFGLLGLAGLQSVGLKNTHSSQIRSEASILAYDIIDRMRSNCSKALGGDYDISLSATTPTSSSAIAGTDIIDWRNAIAGKLNSGTGAVSVNAATFIATVTIQWDDSRATGGASNQQVVVTGVLPSGATCAAT